MLHIRLLQILLRRLKKILSGLQVSEILVGSAPGCLLDNDPLTLLVDHLELLSEVSALLLVHLVEVDLGGVRHEYLHVVLLLNQGLYYAVLFLLHLLRLSSLELVLLLLLEIPMGRRRGRRGLVLDDDIVSTCLDRRAHLLLLIDVCDDG